MTVDCYSLKYVTIGSEEVGARPIGWNSEDIDGFGTNAKGEKVHANKWMTTCTQCANLIEFNAGSIKRVLNNHVAIDHIACPHCEAGLEKLPEDVEESVLDESDAVDATVLVGDVAEFVDPLLSEDFGFEIDYERMPG